jgi:DNA binding domain, excisionase family
MSTEIITKDNERIKSLFCSLDKLLDRIETVMTGYKPSLNGERFLTVTQVSEKLKVSRRALQEYRSNGKIPYIQLGGKTLYRESDIQKLLEQNYREAWE